MTTRILITGALHPTAIESFQGRQDFSVHYAPDLGRQELLSALKETQVLVTRSETTVDREVLEHASELKVIARAAVGVGNIDISGATERGILVINCPGKNTNSAAEMTLALLLAMVRRVPEAHHHLKSGGWDRHRFAGRELRGKRLGIVGLGNVGHRVARFARGFDMKVFAYDPYIAPQVFQRHHATQVNDLAELASSVDVLSVHVPLNRETTGMIDGAILDKMTQGSLVLNLARGGIVDEPALLQRLNSHHLAGAGIDTWVGEPTPLDELTNHSNVWCTPHIGASTQEAQMAIGQTVFAQVVKAIEGGVVDHPVNLPQIGVIDDPGKKAYAVLAEKLGSLIGQIVDFNPQRIEIGYRGTLAGQDNSLVLLGLMKGYAGHVVDGYVSFVNAQSHFEKLGISVTERQDPSFQSYKSALKVWAHGQKGELLTVGGIVFDDSYLRLSLLRDFYFEVEPNGDFVIVQNFDRPGVIGDVGHFLASKGINIDSFDLSRNREGGQAMAVIKIDSAMSDADKRDLAEIKNVISCHSATL